jgi:hypothetical protein
MPRGTTVDPTFLDLTAKECIHLRCRCGRVTCFDPFQLLGAHGITKHTRIFTLKDRFRCRAPKCRRRPELLWIGKWRD